MNEISKTPFVVHTMPISIPELARWSLLCIQERTHNIQMRFNIKKMQKLFTCEHNLMAKVTKPGVQDCTVFAAESKAYGKVRFRKKEARNLDTRLWHYGPLSNWDWDSDPYRIHLKTQSNHTQCSDTTREILCCFLVNSKQLIWDFMSSNKSLNLCNFSSLLRIEFIYI